MSIKRPRILLQLFAKAPQAGFAKTRLIPALGQAGAAALAKRLLENALVQCQRAVVESPPNYQLSIELWVAPEITSSAWETIKINDQIEVHTQVSGDLGVRMAFAAERGLRRAEAIILLGTDCPAIDAARLHWAAEALLAYDSCMLPTYDGGYALLGLRRFSPRLFADIAWSTSAVASVTRQRLVACGMNLCEQAKVHDIDEAADLSHLPKGWL